MLEEEERRRAAEKKKALDYFNSEMSALEEYSHDRHHHDHGHGHVHRRPATELSPISARKSTRRESSSRSSSPPSLSSSSTLLSKHEHETADNEVQANKGLSTSSGYEEDGIERKEKRNDLAVDVIDAFTRHAQRRVEAMKIKPSPHPIPPSIVLPPSSNLGNSASPVTASTIAKSNEAFEQQQGQQHGEGDSSLQWKKVSYNPNMARKPHKRRTSKTKYTSNSGKEKEDTDDYTSDEEEEEFGRDMLERASRPVLRGPVQSFDDRAQRWEELLQANKSSGTHPAVAMRSVAFICG